VSFIALSLWGRLSKAQDGLVSLHCDNMFTHALLYF
jgi:hypothetical protein